MVRHGRNNGQGQTCDSKGAKISNVHLDVPPHSGLDYHKFDPDSRAPARWARRKSILSRGDHAITPAGASPGFCTARACTNYVRMPRTRKDDATMARGCEFAPALDARDPSDRIFI